jgi:hypothetical protein
MYFLKMDHLSIGSISLLSVEEITLFLPDVMAHTCNPSYFGGRDCEDHSSRTAWATF